MRSVIQKVIFIILFSSSIALAISAAAQTFTTLVNFTGSNGGNPQDALVQGSDGNFYGTTYYGGLIGSGTFFVMTPQGNLTTLYQFAVHDDLFGPSGTLVQGHDGNFYGVSGGGNYNAGAIYKITPSGASTPLYSFCSQQNCPDGRAPEAGLILANDGNFYGTTLSGGASNNCGLGCGTIFKITPSGAFTLLHTFAGSDGSYTAAPLVQGRDGYLYGTSWVGGAYNWGTVFKMSLSGTFTLLHSFDISDGAWPESGVVEGSDGNFYGTTAMGGNTGCETGATCGTIFKITPSGTLTTLHFFSGPDGWAPVAGLVLASDGNFYGTTNSLGENDGHCSGDSCGTIYKVTPDGTLTTLHTFDGTDGWFPNGLLQATDRTFYGTTFYGGNNQDQCDPDDVGGCGTIFNLSVPLPTYYTLTVFINGNGTVRSTDGLINCPGTCSHSYLANTAVTLNAAPAQGWTFSGWSGACSGTGPCNLIMTRNLSATATFNLPPNPVQLVTVTPCRLLDTRQSSPIQGGTFQTFDMEQLAQQQGCADLSTASSYSLNVTLIPQNGAPVHYLTIWPAGENRPGVSTMNSLDGRIKANAAIVPAGTNSSVSVYVTDTANIVLDIDGYFATPGASTLRFFPLIPCRVADTRSNNFPQGLGLPHLSGGVPRNFPVLSSSCQIPANALAYSLNFTAVPYPSGSGNRLGYLEVWPTGQEPENPVSTLNNPTGTIVANAAIVPAGTNGNITAYASQETDLVIDVNGYFSTTGQNGLSLYATTPCRVFDTRQVGNGQPFSGTLSPPVDVVDSGCGVPGSALGYVFNATVVPSGGLGYLTLWPDGQAQPGVSTLNAADGKITSNMAIVPNAGDGKIDAYAAGLTQLILDIFSYFAP